MGFHVIWTRYKIMRPGIPLAMRFILLIVIVCLVTDTSAQDPVDLKKLSLEELMDVKVTSVSRRPEKLAEVASAIQVITQQDIRRSGATSIPEALRLAPNLQVAQLNSSAWIISARGFNAVFSNKLLVMIDGRTVYSPLFAGVFWDVQHVLLEDVERIEVISGPGGTAWGANAVNGVINIITKRASETQGFYATVGMGTHLRKNAAVRYGGKIGSDLSYRVYGLYTERDHTTLVNETDNSDAWSFGQGGFSLDWQASESDRVAAHANFNAGSHENQPSVSTLDGQNILGHWTHDFSETSTLVVRAYYDRTWRRDVPSTISDQAETYDLDIDHSFSKGARHNIVWGVGYRFIRDETDNSTPIIGLVPKSRDMPLYSAFIQDEISLAGDRLRLIVGTKLQHNVFSDFELQPSGRLAWSGKHYTLWTAVSRAVRAPSRIDVDYHLPTYPVPPPGPSVAGGPNFTSEKLMAYELGYRLQPVQGSFFSVAAFYNSYDDLYSVEALPGTLTFQIQNGTTGRSGGVELSGQMQVKDWWRVRGGYSYFYKELANKPGHTYDYSDLGNDAENRVMLQSMLDLPANFQFDLTFRYIGALPKPEIPEYMTFDARLAWVGRSVEFAVIGRNLREDRHQEFSAYIPRNIYGTIACRF